MNGKPSPTLVGRLTWHWPQVVWQPAQLAWKPARAVSLRFSKSI